MFNYLSLWQDAAARQYECLTFCVHYTFVSFISSSGELVIGKRLTVSTLERLRGMLDATCTQIRSDTGAYKAGTVG